MKTTRKPVVQRQQQGSALLVSLMVMVGLSLLGLGFVAISETESSISVNQRNYSQTLDVAEAGAKTVVEWFQDPDWAVTRGLLPPNTISIKTLRNLTLPTAYSGYYKPITTVELLCDLPFKPDLDNRLFGDEDSADITINAARGSDATTFLARFNAHLFETSQDGGRITEIKIYAPPMVNGTLTENPAGSGLRFYNAGTRYGVATVKVTATKYMPDDTTVLAQRTVKIVVADFPFPGPEGPLQSNTGISTNGAFRVHWGKVTSQGDMSLKRPFTSIPWRTAWQQSHIEQGYNAADFPTDAASGNIEVKYNWLYELIDKSIEDPWYQGRARGDISTDGGITFNQAYPYDDPTDDPEGEGIAGYSNQFQNQDTNDEAINKKEVLFPKIDYFFWKTIAQAGAAAGTEGIYYLTHVSGVEFVDTKGNQKTFDEWTNTVGTPPAKGGLYFFETIGNVNPQKADGTTDTTVLTPKIALNGLYLHMRGFIYVNTTLFDTTGLSGLEKEYNMPGETYRDVGFREVATQTVALPIAQTEKYFVRDAGGLVAPLANAVNGTWDFQDLPWSNGSTTVGNGKFDVFIKSETVVRDSDGATIIIFKPVPYYEDPDGAGPLEACHPGDNATLGPDPDGCSEPHEPYLNFIYPDEGTDGSGDALPVTVKWEDPAGVISRKPKKFADLAETTVVACGASNPESECTSNAYDEKGALVLLNAGSGPILDGVLYNEGDYEATGNAMYFGSVLIRGNVGKGGNADVFFDESLVKGDWQKRFKDLPRVLITSSQTDQ